MRRIRPLAVLGTRIDLVAVFIDPIAVLRRSDQVDVMTIAAAGVPGDAIENRRPVQKVTDIPTQGFDAYVVGHRSPVELVCRLYECTARGGCQNIRRRSSEETMTASARRVGAETSKTRDA